MGELEMAGGGEKIAGETGNAGGLAAAKEGVTGPGEVDFVDEIELGEMVDELAAAFTMEAVDMVVAVQGGDEFGD